MKKISVFLLLIETLLVLTGCTRNNMLIVSRFEALKGNDYFEVIENDKNNYDVYSVDRSNKNLVFSKEQVIEYQIEDKNCILIVDDSLLSSTYSRERVFLLQGASGEILDLGVHLNAVLLGSYIGFKKYYTEPVDSRIEIELFSIPDKKFIEIISLTTLVTKYLGSDWFNFVSSGLENKNGELLVFFESEGLHFLDILIDPKTQEYKVAHYWKDDK